MELRKFVETQTVGVGDEAAARTDTSQRTLLPWAGVLDRPNNTGIWHEIYSNSLKRLEAGEKSESRSARSELHSRVVRVGREAAGDEQRAVVRISGVVSRTR